MAIKSSAANSFQKDSSQYAIRTVSTMQMIHFRKLGTIRIAMMLTPVNCKYSLRCPGLRTKALMDASASRLSGE
ncbi:hypothetical protein D3C71_1639080 [compost metagenome]